MNPAVFDEVILANLRVAEQQKIKELCAALGEPYESEDGHGMRAHTWPEMLAMVQARSGAWRTLLTRIEVVDPVWLDQWRRNL